MMIQTTNPQCQALYTGRAYRMLRDKVWFECAWSDPIRRVEDYDAGIIDGRRTVIGTAQRAFREIRAIVPGSTVTAAGKLLSPRPKAALSPKDRLPESEEAHGTA